MKLATYRKKRDFARTPEPKGGGKAVRTSRLRYLIQKHAATRLHYDFRLEWDGTLKSWAVPKGPSLDPARKVLAVQVEDHPLEYGTFEGTIPKGQYGGGTVMLWDQGTWQPLDDPANGLKNGKLHFELHGQKLQGEWDLVRMHGQAGGGGKNWLLIKKKDAFSGQGNVLEDDPQSVKTRRSMEEITEAGDAQWQSKRNGHADNGQTKKSPARASKLLPADFSPQLAVLAAHPPEGEEWLHEIKFDGYRLVALVDRGHVSLITRGGKDWTGKFPTLAKALATLNSESAVLDGEAVLLDAQGRSDFQALQSSFQDSKGAKPTFFAFDLLFLQGQDLRNLPLLQRKGRLATLLTASHLTADVRYSDHVRGSGDAVVKKACIMGLEGIVSKRVDAPYVPRRDASWLKSKCAGRQEFVIIGYTNPMASRQGFGALLLGYHNPQKKLVYAGRVGTGFDDQQLKDMRRRLQAIGRDHPPTDVAPPKREQKEAHWVEPKLVCEVRFTGWTRDGVLRHPAFVALRTDKQASQIVRELPVEPEQVSDIKDQPLPNTNKMPSRKRIEKPTKLKSVRKTDAAIAGVTLTHPDRVLFEEKGITKRDLAQYYEFVWKWMEPHVVNRPLSLLRCPKGRGSACFMQRNWSSSMPKAVRAVNVGAGGKKEMHVMAGQLSGIVALVQMSVLEIHTWNCSSADVEHADQLVFDLDPGDGVSWDKVKEAAQAVRKALTALQLPAFLKTSGGKGLHLTVPIRPNIQWQQAKAFAATLAHSLAEKSEMFIANMRKDLRKGKIYVDYNRNDRTATAVAPYSTRARQGAPISMPISWEELKNVKAADQFQLPEVHDILAKRKSDPWRDFDKARVDLRQVIQ